MANYDPLEFSGKLRGLGISRPYASQLATGARTPSMSLAMSICERLGISLDVWREISDWKVLSQDVAFELGPENGNLAAKISQVQS
jgi:transcriptional regulator with XRE-family HTH domain